MLDKGLLIKEDGTTTEINGIIECENHITESDDNVFIKEFSDLRGLSFTCSVNYANLTPILPRWLSIDEFKKVPDMPGYRYIYDSNIVITEDALKAAIDEYNAKVIKLHEDALDYEWGLAENADEKPIYYFAEMYNGGRRVKKYKPSVAKLISKRTTLKMVPAQEELLGKDENN